MDTKLKHNATKLGYTLAESKALLAVYTANLNYYKCSNNGPSCIGSTTKVKLQQLGTIVQLYQDLGGYIQNYESTIKIW